MRILWTIAVLAVGMACSRPALAQDEKVGLTMGYPTAIGVLWQVSEGLGIRPEISWAHSSIDIDSRFSQASTDSTGVGFAISGLVRLRQWGAVRSYVAPRFEAVRTTNETTIDLPSPQFPTGFPSTQTTKTTGTSYEGGGSIGVQASPAPHFGVFGEIGVMYGRGRLKGDSSIVQNTPETQRSRTLGLRSAVGAILYF